MSRKSRRQPHQPAAASPAPIPQPPRRIRFARVVIGCALLGLILGAWWWWRQPSPAAIPEVDFTAIDPLVAASLRQRIEEVRRDPRSGSAWGWLGALLWTYDFRTEAGQCLARAEDLEPANARWPYYHALMLGIATPNDAIPLLETAVRICGNSPEIVRFRLAHLFAEQGRWDEARREFEPLLIERPAFSPARLLSARAAEARGELDTAIELARACADDARTARSAQVLMAGLCRQKGDAAGAAQALRLSTSLPEDQTIEDPYRAEITLFRNDPRMLCEQAHPLLAAGHLAQAATLIDRLKSNHASYAETWLLVGRLQLLRKDLAGADQALRRHVEMNPRSAQGFFQLGMTLLTGGQLTNAAVMFEKAVQLKPDFGPAHYNRGLALGRANQLQEAIEAFRESLRHNPERLETYLFLSDLHLRAGDREGAIAFLDQAQSIDPDDARLKALRQRAMSAASRERSAN